MTGVSYAYDAAPVLQDVDLTIDSGRVTALLGGNGSGKSTLIKLLAGVMSPRAGEIQLDGKRIEFANPAEALDAGIAVVHQHQQLFPDLSVADNVIGIHTARPRHALGLLVDRQAAAGRVVGLFEEFGIEVDPSWPVRRLGSAERTFLQIARALIEKPRFLILDEPTASLQPAPARRVLVLMESMSARGVGILFVSHRLAEVATVSDDAVILRDGRVAARRSSPLTERDLAAQIVGSQQEAGARGGKGPAFGEPSLKFEAGGVELVVRRGEILGLAGLPQSGATEAICRIAGQLGPTTVDVAEGPRRLRSPRDAVRAGIGFVPENRQKLGLLGDLSVATNLTLPALHLVSRAGMLRRVRVDSKAGDMVRRLDIRCPSILGPTRTLSGGNQQKVVVGKWLAAGVRVLAIEEPTHGVDIAGKAQIHALLREFVEEGGAVVVASAEPEELVALCDRIAVFDGGAVVAALKPDELRGADELEAVINGAGHESAGAGGVSRAS